MSFESSSDVTRLCVVIAQIVEVIDPMARQDRLDALLKKYHASRKNRVLVFVLYKKEAARIESFLQRRGWKVSYQGCYLNCYILHWCHK